MDIFKVALFCTYEDNKKRLKRRSLLIHYWHLYFPQNALYCYAVSGYHSLYSACLWIVAGLLGYSRKDNFSLHILCLKEKIVF